MKNEFITKKKQIVGNEWNMYSNCKAYKKYINIDEDKF